MMPNAILILICLIQLPNMSAALYPLILPHFNSTSSPNEDHPISFENITNERFDVHLTNDPAWGKRVEADFEFGPHQGTEFEFLSSLARRAATGKDTMRTPRRYVYGKSQVLPYFGVRHSRDKSDAARGLQKHVPWP